MREPTSNIQNGLLKCNLDKTNHSLFFSLVDYRNNLFTSNDPKKIIEFYDGFDNRDQLIQWMKERPKGVSYIHEVEGDKDIIVVIPTADFNGKYARECRDNIFKGIHMVFVESGIGNFYFNYAHNCNVGIKKAMEYNPKWVVVSNDDMRKVESPEKLREELLKQNSDEIWILNAQGSGPHSRLMKVGTRSLFALILLLSQNNRTILMIEKSLRYKVGKILIAESYSLKHRFFTKKLFSVRNVASFFIVSKLCIKTTKGNLFDEIFINGYEDFDLDLRYIKSNQKEINYKIDDIGEGGMTLGGIQSMRFARDIANRIYLSQLYFAGIYPI